MRKLKIRGIAHKVYSSTVVGVPSKENKGDYEEIIQEDFSELRQEFLVCERIYQVLNLLDENSPKAHSYEQMCLGAMSFLRRKSHYLRVIREQIP